MAVTLVIQQGLYTLADPEGGQRVWTPPTGKSQMAIGFLKIILVRTPSRSKWTPREVRTVLPMFMTKYTDTLECRYDMLLWIHDTGFPQALEIMENLEND